MMKNRNILMIKKCDIKLLEENAFSFFAKNKLNACGLCRKVVTLHEHFLRNKDGESLNKLDKTGI